MIKKKRIEVWSYIFIAIIWTLDHITFRQIEDFGRDAGFENIKNIHLMIIFQIIISVSRIVLYLNGSVYWYFCFCVKICHICSIQHGIWKQIIHSPCCICSTFAPWNCNANKVALVDWRMTSVSYWDGHVNSNSVTLTVFTVKCPTAAAVFFLWF